MPPLVIAALVLAARVGWRACRRIRRSSLSSRSCYVLYLTAAADSADRAAVDRLGVAIAYPILWANELTGTNTLFEIPVFKAFPNMDTMVAIVIFAMMAIGLNMVVGYAGLLDLGYVAFYAIGAYTAAWLASPHFASDGIDFEFGGDRRAAGRRRHPHLDLDRPRRRSDHDGDRRRAHRLAHASAAG